jgi:hypothetical protein
MILDVGFAFSDHVGVRRGSGYQGRRRAGGIFGEHDRQVAGTVDPHPLSGKEDPPLDPGKFKLSENQTRSNGQVR